MPKQYHQHVWSDTVEEDYRQIVLMAVREDLSGQQDWTTAAIVPQDAQGKAKIVARRNGVVAGLRAAGIVFDVMGASVALEPEVIDGDTIGVGQVLAKMSGSARDMLTCERILLNLIGRLSGIATLTARFVEAVRGTNVSIFDTRKTTPGWRRLEKYAVHCGGGYNHRTGLYDAIMIKDNHLAFLHDAIKNDASSASSPALAIRRVRKFLATTPCTPDIRELIVEIEVDTITQLESVLSEQPDVVLLDNMDNTSLQVASAVRNAVAPSVVLEASGGVTLDSVRCIAESGVDRISVGALTHSAICLDIGLDWHMR